MTLKSKSPIGYYGGKNGLWQYIKLLLKYSDIYQYIEPFAGGLSVLFNKKPHTKEVINDIDNRILIFWECCRSNFDELQDEIKNTLHHESLHKKASIILLEPYNYSIKMQAWAFWVQTQMSFSKKINGGFAHDNTVK